MHTTAGQERRRGKCGQPVRVPKRRRFLHSVPRLSSISDAWGRLNVVTPFHHLSGDRHLHRRSVQVPLRHLDRVTKMRTSSTSSKRMGPAGRSASTRRYARRPASSPLADTLLTDSPWRTRRTLRYGTLPRDSAVGFLCHARSPQAVRRARVRK